MGVGGEGGRAACAACGPVAGPPWPRLIGGGRGARAGRSGMEGGRGKGAGGYETREFYEFVLPPVDISVDASGRAVVVIDVPGFGIDDISVRVEGDLLTVRAERPEAGGAGKGGEPAAAAAAAAVQLQRPRRLDKTIRLPVRAGAGARESCTARCADGVLTVIVPAA